MPEAHHHSRWIDRLRSTGEKLVRELAETFLAMLSGRQAAPQLEAIYERHGELASQETFERLQAEASGAGDVRTSEALGRLLELVGETLERRAAAPATDRRLGVEAALQIHDEGATIGYRAAPAAIRDCPDPARRQRLFRAYLDAVSQVAPLVSEERERAREAMAEVGGEDYVKLRSILMGHDVDHLAGIAETLLTSTHDIVDDARAWLFKEQVELAAAEPLLPDLWHAMRATSLDGLLMASERWRVDDFLRRLGLDPEAGGRIRRDEDGRPETPSETTCVALRVPAEVHLVVGASAGLPCWRSLLHGVGHALHLANVDPARPFEDSRLGDRSVSEGYAALLDHLLANPVWARRVLGLSAPDADRLVRVAAAASLLLTRRHAAQLIYEVGQHRNERDDGERYEEILGRATGVRPPGELHLLCVLPDLRCARDLRAGLFEAALHHELRERYDEDWFLNPRAGAHLLRLFSEGQARDADRIADEEFGCRLQASAVVRRYEEVLG